MKSEGELSTRRRREREKGEEGTTGSQSTHLIQRQIESRKDVSEMKLSDLLRLSVRSSQIPQQKWRVEGEGIEVFRSDGVDLREQEGKTDKVREARETRRARRDESERTFPPRASSAHWASASPGAWNP